MIYLYVALSALFSFIVLFLLTKLMGFRQVSQLSIFDYINGITIGSITADLATCAADNWLSPLIAMVVYALAVWVFAVITDKSIKVRRFIYGETVVLFENGKMLEDNMKKSKIDINEFQMQCRNQGYFTFCDIETAILETNGKISVMPKAEKRPVNPEDLSLKVQKDGLVTNIIIDGELLLENLKSTGNNEVWLNKQLQKEGIGDISRIMLAECDKNNSLKIYKKKSSSNTGSFDK